MPPGTRVSQNQVLCVLNTSSVDSSTVQFFIHSTRVSQTQVWFGYRSSTIQAHTRVHWIRVWLRLQAHHTWVHWTRVVYCHTKVKSLTSLYFPLLSVAEMDLCPSNKGLSFFWDFEFDGLSKMYRGYRTHVFLFTWGRRNIWEKVTFFFFFENHRK